MFSPNRLPNEIGSGKESRKDISAELIYQNGGAGLLEELENSGALLSREQRYELTKEKETLGSDLRALETRMKKEAGLYGEYNKLNDRLMRVEKILASKVDVKSYGSNNYQ